MLLWKLFAAVSGLIYLAYGYSVLKGTELLRRVDVFYIPVGVIGTFGVFAYAYSVTSIPTIAWTVFLPIYVGVTGWEIAEVVADADADVGTYVGIGLVMILAGFTSVALFRLGGWV